MISNLPTADLLGALLAQADFYPRLPHQRRLYEALKSAILSKRLGVGSKLPSTRNLAQDLSMARNSVIAAYEQLIMEGFVNTAAGSGTFVSASATNSHALPPRSLVDTSALAEHETPLPDISLSQRGQQLTAFSAGPRCEIQPFAPGDADFSTFPFKLWQRLRNRVWRDIRPELLDYGQAGGYLPLRQAITDYLRVSRSVKLSLDQVMITAGTQHSLDLCAQLLADAGDTIWVEEPCYWAAKRVFEACALKLHPVAVDAEGIAFNQDDLQTNPRLIYVTPSHQYPTGSVMSLARRTALLEFAKNKKSWILEDDYDSEFRYTGRPLAALQGLDTDGRVVYMGTFSKVLYPGIKIGYLVVPKGLSHAFKSALYDLQRPGQVMVQAVLADFIAMGHFTIHIRKIRQTYGARRELLHKTLLAHLGSLAGSTVSISPEESGLHLVVYLPDHVDDVQLSKLAAESGIAVNPLSTYYMSKPVRRGLIVGYAYVTPEKILYYGKLLASIIQAGIDQGSHHGLDA